MIEIDPTSPVPLYLQIVEQMRRLIAMGALQPGERLPAVRDLAVKVRVNRNTAARAIQHLESAGLVRTRVGQGSFVADSVARIDRARVDQAIDESLDRLLVEAHTFGLPLEEIGWRLSQRIEAFGRRRQAEAHSGNEEESG